MKSAQAITDTCNALLRGELSAIETYTQAIEKFSANSSDSPLERIREDHETSAASLRELIGESGDETATDSGLWESIATSVEGAASLLDESPALTLLQQGEKHGITECENALDDDELDDSVKDFIRDELLPSQKDDLVELERCKTKVG